MVKVWRDAKSPQMMLDAATHCIGAEILCIKLNKK